MVGGEGSKSSGKGHNNNPSESQVRRKANRQAERQAAKKQKEWKPIRKAKMVSLAFVVILLLAILLAVGVSFMEGIQMLPGKRFAAFNRANEEAVEKKRLEAICKSQCVKPFLAYQDCVEELRSDKRSGYKHCTAGYVDQYQSCVDQCVASKF